MPKDKILVSVIMPVYNHEPYITQAIEGVLMQKTTFKYELIIGEDCSTDKSREIIREYQKKYPDIIHPVYWKKNVGANRNANTIRLRARGKYIATCEGDDYWCDENKLQKQIDFLQNNLQYSAIYHNVCCVDEKGRECKRKSINKYVYKENGTYTFDMIKGMRLVGQGASIVYRNIHHHLSGEQIRLFHKCECNGDQKLCVTLACLGDVYYMEDVMACHRVVLRKGDSWSAQTYEKNLCLLNYHMYLELVEYLKKGFCRDYKSIEFEKGLCKNSAYIFKKAPSVSNLRIYISVNFLYILEKVKNFAG